MVHILSVRGYNLTDALYRRHTSFIKDLAPEVGRGVKLAYSMRSFDMHWVNGSSSFVWK